MSLQSFIEKALLRCSARIGVCGFHGKEVRRVISDHSQELHACIFKSPEMFVTLSQGNIMLNWWISAEGKTSDIRAFGTDSKQANNAFSECSVSVISSWKFAPPPYSKPFQASFYFKGNK